MTAERITLLLVGCLNVGAGALLAANFDLPTAVRGGLVVAQAIAVYVLATVKSWDDAAPSPSPHG